MSYVIGIDPGWASCGWAITDGGKLLASGHFIPRDFTGSEGEVLVGAVEELTESIERTVRAIQPEPDPEFSFHIVDVAKVYIERYVAYKGVQSQAAEDILLYIGALIHRFEFDGVTVVPVRAIDWKPKVCKYLVRSRNFNNPYPSFDKKYSILAANELSGKQFKTDHEADAVCLSYMGVVDQYDRERLRK